MLIRRIISLLMSAAWLLLASASGFGQDTPPLAPTAEEYTYSDWFVDDRLLTDSYAHSLVAINTFSTTTIPNIIVLQPYGNPGLGFVQGWMAMPDELAFVTYRFPLEASLYPVQHCEVTVETGSAPFLPFTGLRVSISTDGSGFEEIGYAEEIGTFTYEAFVTEPSFGLYIEFESKMGVLEGFTATLTLSETPYSCGAFTGGYTGNTDCDFDGNRNLADISRLIDRVYISRKPLCLESEGDTNGDTKINLADISRLIDHVYISKEETAPCD